MEKSEDVPKNLSMKVGTEEEAYWTEIKESAEREIATYEKLMKFQRAVLDMANKFISAEREVEDEERKN
jgi:hypothetical protein